jgi:predicted GTPase
LNPLNISCWLKIAPRLPNAPGPHTLMTAGDILTTTLAARAEELVALIDEEQSPIKSSRSNARLNQAVIELQNITRALGQYARVDRSLRYIGLMGTFSSGKSSIINSLLDQQVRRTDLPPVDAEITILSHSANRHALISAQSRGKLQVTTQPIDSPFLKDCFIVDTPGSGDPEINKEMVKDFLPVCDLILYAFSAAHALTDSDLSVLKILQDQLDFVPLIFVITRTDEFRNDPLAPLTKENVNHIRLDQFLAQLIARIRNQAPKLNLSVDHFFFIDNIAKYGLGELRERISSELKSDTHLHANNLRFFNVSSGLRKPYFLLIYQS